MKDDKDKLIKDLLFILEDLVGCESYIMSRMPEEGIAIRQVRGCFERAKEILKTNTK